MDAPVSFLWGPLGDVYPVCSRGNLVALETDGKALVGSLGFLVCRLQELV